MLGQYYTALMAHSYHHQQQKHVVTKFQKRHFRNTVEDKKLQLILISFSSVQMLPMEWEKYLISLYRKVNILWQKDYCISNQEFQLYFTWLLNQLCSCFQLQFFQKIKGKRFSTTLTTLLNILQQLSRN